MPFGIDTADFDMSGVPAFVWLILVIVGLLLCFFGEIIWEFMISILGAIIGSMIGLAIGFALGGYLCGLGLMFLFAIIGSMLFQLLAKGAVALLCALMAFGGVAYLSFTAGLADTASFIIGLIVGVIIFIIVRVYVEEIISVFLAAIGGFLVGTAVYFLAEGDLALAYALLAGGAMFILGAVFQIFMQRERKGPARAPPKKEPMRETTKTTTTTTPKEQPTPSHEPKTPTEGSKPSKPSSGQKTGDMNGPSH